MLDRISAAMGLKAKHPGRVGSLAYGAILTVLLAAAVVVTASDGVSATTSTAGAPFTFNFEGNPTSPQPWRPTSWDVVVNSRDVRTFVQLEGMQAQHGVDCGPYPSTHFNNTYDGAVFQCRNHVMTAINAGGYGEIVLSPDHMVDFAGGATTIRFNLSTLRTSFRDWASIWITPFDDNLVLPIDPGERVDLQGPPRRGIQVRMDQGAGLGTIWRGAVIDNFKATSLPLNGLKTLEKLLGSTSAVTRTTFELTISRNHIKFGAPTLGFYWIDAAIPQLPWSRGVVQLSHHSYNPTKHCTPSGTLTCLPDTWHWSNFSISNAVPFTLLRGDQQVLHAANSQLGVAATPTVVNFPAPAPASAFLRFAAIGGVDISLDGGKTWQAARRQSQLYSTVDHFSSYFTPIPAGTTRVWFRGHNWGFSANPGGPWWIRDVAIWSTVNRAGAPTTGTTGATGSTPPARATTTGTSITMILAAALTNPLIDGSLGLLVLGGVAALAWAITRRRRRLQQR